MRHWLAAAAALGHLVALAGCQAMAVQGSACGRASDCTSPLVCRFGSCRVECRLDVDCNAGARCLVVEGAGACALPQDSDCPHTQCPSGTVCLDGACATTCLDAADCPGGPCVSLLVGGTTIRGCGDARDDRDAAIPDAGGNDAELDAWSQTDAQQGDDAAIDDAATLDPGAITVSTDAMAIDDATCGLGPTSSATHPCRTITHGLARAAETGRTRVRVADGTYIEDVVVVAGIDLLGGYRADTWARHVETTLTTVQGTSGAGPRRAIVATDIAAPTLVEGFVVRGADATTPGASSYAIWVSGGTGALAFRGNVVYAGAGAAGAAGADGVDGASGVDGAVGANGFDTMMISVCTGSRAGAAGGTRSCGAGRVDGGAGGGVQCSPTYTSGAVPCTPVSAMAGAPGSGSAPGVGGAAGCDYQYSASGGTCTFCVGGAGTTMSGLAGAPGTRGANGAGGPGASNATGSVALGDWVGDRGVDGSSGTHGSGGGGGGAGGGADGRASCTLRLGAGGGGGGSGGCAGTLGIGGEPGGASFAVFVIGTSTPPELTGNTIVRGAGGSGGAGGRGGTGGMHGTGRSGGVGAPVFCAGDAGPGGDGGDGGSGGGGGGGAGGVSYGIYVAGATSVGATTNTFPASGSGGLGGAGGPSIVAPGGRGATGISAETN